MIEFCFWTFNLVWNIIVTRDRKRRTARGAANQTLIKSWRKGYPLVLSRETEPLVLSGRGTPRSCSEQDMRVVIKLRKETYEAGSDLPGCPHKDMPGLVDESAAVDSVTVLVGIHLHWTHLQKVRHDALICSSTKKLSEIPKSLIINHLGNIFSGRQKHFDQFDLKLTVICSEHCTPPCDVTLVSHEVILVLLGHANRPDELVRGVRGGGEPHHRRIVSLLLLPVPTGLLRAAINSSYRIKIKQQFQIHLKTNN